MKEKALRFCKTAFDAICNFIKTHIPLVVSVCVVVVVLVVATPVTIHFVNVHHDATKEAYAESSLPALDKQTEEKAKQEQENGLPSQKEQEEADNKAVEETKIEDAKTEPKEDASSNKSKETKPSTTTSQTTTKPSTNSSGGGSSKEDQPSNNTTSKKDQTTQNNSSETPQTTTKPKPSNTNTTTTVVQRADPSTGISWDGKSAIVYTYADGSTGTTPKDGATYEVMPGLKGTFTAPKQETTSQTATGVCSTCGKKEGDGSHGTCMQFWAHDDNCPNCGTLVPVNTCHSCK